MKRERSMKRERVKNNEGGKQRERKIKSKCKKEGHREKVGLTRLAR